MKDNPDRNAYLATVGMFDGFHRGHQWLVGHVVELAHKSGLQPLILTFDRHPLSVLCPDAAPGVLTSLSDKTDLLRRSTDARIETLEFTKDLAALDAASFLKRIASDFGVRAFAMGFNNHIGSDRKDFNATSALGLMPIVGLSSYPDSPVSSSEIRSLIKEGNTEGASELLGRSYSFKGKVVGGRHLGRKIGFPTANIVPSEAEQLIPADGVYATDILIEGDSVPHRAMMNIGHRPTVDMSAVPARTIEAHILDFEGNLYGKEIEVRFLARIRDEHRFDSLEALSEQLSIDRENVRIINSGSQFS